MFTVDTFLETIILFLVISHTFIRDPVEFSLKCVIQTLFQINQGSSHAFIHQIGKGISVWHLCSLCGEMKRFALLQ